MSTLKRCPRIRNSRSGECAVFEEDSTGTVWFANPEAVFRVQGTVCPKCAMRWDIPSVGFNASSRVPDGDAVGTGTAGCALAGQQLDTTRRSSGVAGRGHQQHRQGSGGNFWHLEPGILQVLADRSGDGWVAARGADLPVARQ